jgi:DNA-binding protein H-NS
MNTPAASLLSLSELTELASSLSLPELKELTVAVARVIATREAEAVNNARAQINEIARSVGVPLKDLMDSMKAPKAPGTVAVKYRDPSEPKNQWTGRGRMPQWAAKLNEAGQLESARV